MAIDSITYLYPKSTEPTIGFHLSRARLCLNCSTVHNGDGCPLCTSTHFLVLEKVLNEKATKVN